MLDEDTLDKLIPEIYSRLTMMDDELDYEIAVPNRDAALGVIGGGKHSEVRFVPIVTTGGSRRDLPPKVFRHASDGTMVVAGRTYPNIRVISVDAPTVELYEWLRSDPWSAVAADPPVFCGVACGAKAGCSGSCRRPHGHTSDHFCSVCSASW